jgi:hypothetical protein
VDNRATRPGRYLKLLHGNVLGLHGSERTSFMLAMGQDAQQITDHELSTLLDSEWRARLTAAWLIGLDRRTRFRDRLAGLLLDSQLVYAGQGYCLALARFETTADTDLLCAYLDRYLPRGDLHYDQHWSVGALLHLDERLGSSRAIPYLTPGGPWQQTAWQRSAMSTYDPAEQHRRIACLCAFASECMRDAAGGQCSTPGNQP